MKLQSTQQKIDETKSLSLSDTRFKELIKEIQIKSEKE